MHGALMLRPSESIVMNGSVLDYERCIEQCRIQANRVTEQKIKFYTCIKHHNNLDHINMRWYYASNFHIFFTNVGLLRLIVVLLTITICMKISTVRHFHCLFPVERMTKRISNIQQEAKTTTLTAIFCFFFHDSTSDIVFWWIFAHFLVSINLVRCIECSKL